MKNCSKCGERKPITEFHQIKGRDGERRPSSRCRDCAKAAARESYYRRKKDSSQNIDSKREQRSRLAEARKKGQKTFLPVLPCRHGHLSPKLVSTQQCTKCLELRSLKSRPSDEYSRAKRRNSYRRKTAKNLGMTRFNGVLPCPKGHIGERLVSTGQCCQCLSDREPSNSVSDQARKRALEAKRIERKRAAKRRKVQAARNSPPQGMRKCATCDGVSSESNFDPSTKTKEGLDTHCKSCRKKIRSDRYQRNREKILSAQRQYSHENRVKISDRRKRRYRENIEKHRAEKRRYYYQNKSELIRKIGAYRVKRYREDPVFAVEVRCRARILGAFRQKGYTKKSRTYDIVGCSFEHLCQHLESQFKPGMRWDNRSEWHIDHIVPLATAKTEDDVIRLCHYTNLQPLWAHENFAKSDKLPE